MHDDVKIEWFHGAKAILDLPAIATSHPRPLRLWAYQCRLHAGPCFATISLSSLPTGSEAGLPTSVWCASCRSGHRNEQEHPVAAACMMYAQDAGSAEQLRVVHELCS